MDRLIDLKQCTESYYNNNPSSLIEDVFALLNLITKASRIIKEYDELQNLSTTKNKINNENIKKELEYWNNISTFFKNRVSETPHLPINNFYPQPTTYLQNNEKGWNPIYADIDNLFIRDVIKPTYLNYLTSHITRITTKDLNLFYGIKEKIIKLFTKYKIEGTSKQSDEYTYRRNKEYQIYKGLTLCYYAQIQIILYYTDTIIEGIWNISSNNNDSY